MKGKGCVSSVASVFEIGYPSACTYEDIDSVSLIEDFCHLPARLISPRDQGKFDDWFLCIAGEYRQGRSLFLFPL